MSDTEHILLESGLTPEATALMLGEVLHAQVAPLDTGALAVSRRVASDPVRLIVGEVVENDYAEDDPAPGEESIYDAYHLVLELWVSGKSDEELLHAEARRIFNEIVDKLSWPIVHTHVGGLLYSASSPGLGRTDFPPGTAYDSGSRDLWQPYAQP